VPSAKLIVIAVAIIVVVSWGTHASPLIPEPAGLFGLSQRSEPVRWRYRYYRRGGDDDERQYESFWRRDASVQSSDPAIEMLRSSSRRGGRWIDPPPPR
jgi:hypothetical protein